MRNVPKSIAAPPPRPAAGSARLPAGQQRLLVRIVAAGAGGLELGAADPAAAALERCDLVARRGDRVFASAAGRAHAARAAKSPAPFLAQHVALGAGTAEVDGVRADVLIDLDESPLAWLARRKGRDGRPLLAPEWVTAGERLRADFTRGQMTPRVTSSWEGAVSGGRRGGAGVGVDLADAVLAARTRVARALDAVGPELSGVLLDVCCFLKGLEAVEQSRNWPARGAKLVLGLALARLAAHYGYGAAQGAERGGRIVGWGTPDSRPSIDGGALG